jgi:hypothetical protein
MKNLARPADNDNEELDSALLRINLPNFIGRLEWRIDLKLLHLEEFFG